MNRLYQRPEFRDFAGIVATHGGTTSCAATLWRRIRRLGCRNAWLFEAENDSANYQTAADRENLRELREETDARMARLENDLAAYGLGIDWPGLYPVLTAPDKHNIHPF